MGSTSDFKLKMKKVGNKIIYVLTYVKKMGKFIFVGTETTGTGYKKFDNMNYGRK